MLTIGVVVFILTSIPHAKSQYTSPVNKDSLWLYLGQTPPGLIPERFPPEYLLANEEWFWHGPPVFSPNLREMFYIKYFADTYVKQINFVKYENGTWTLPQPVDFSLSDHENNPVFYPDSNSLYFISMINDEKKIFNTIRVNGEWSTPEMIEIPVPSTYVLGWQFSIANTGNLCFELYDKDYLYPPDIYVSEYNNGSYNIPENLGETINTDYNEFNPYIDPEEHFIIFVSDRPGGYGLHDLYISTRNPDNTWSNPQNLGENINSMHEDGFPMISPDNKYFFFNTIKDGDEGYNPYWVDIHVLDPFLSTGIENKQSDIVLRTFPNPFSNSTTIEYKVKDHYKVSLKIYDLYGKEIKTLIDVCQTPGSKTLIWDGTNNSGQAVPTGVYYCRIHAGNDTHCRKIIFTKS